MKIATKFFFIGMIATHSIAYSQDYPYVQNGLEMTVAGHREIKSSNSNNVFFVRLRNLSNKNIKIPRSYYAYPGTSAPLGNLKYELVYCGTKEADETIKLHTPISEPLNFHEWIDLKPDEKYLIEIDPIDGSAFSKKGIYKIRFISVHSKDFLELPILSTPWEFFTITD